MRKLNTHVPYILKVLLFERCWKSKTQLSLDSVWQIIRQWKTRRFIESTQSKNLNLFCRFHDMFGFWDENLQILWNLNSKKFRKRSLDKKTQNALFIYLLPLYFASFFPCVLPIQDSFYKILFVLLPNDLQYAQRRWPQLWWDAKKSSYRKVIFM